MSIARARCIHSGGIIKCCKRALLPLYILVLLSVPLSALLSPFYLEPAGYMKKKSPHVFCRTYSIMESADGSEISCIGTQWEKGAKHARKTFCTSLELLRLVSLLYEEEPESNNPFFVIGPQKLSHINVTRKFLCTAVSFRGHLCGTFYSLLSLDRTKGMQFKLQLREKNGSEYF